MDSFSQSYEDIVAWNKAVDADEHQSIAFPYDTLVSDAGTPLLELQDHASYIGSGEEGRTSAGSPPPLDSGSDSTADCVSPLLQDGVMPQQYSHSHSHAHMHPPMATTSAGFANPVMGAMPQMFRFTQGVYPAYPEYGEEHEPSCPQSIQNQSLRMMHAGIHPGNLSISPAALLPQYSFNPYPETSAVHRPSQPTMPAFQPGQQLQFSPAPETLQASASVSDGRPISPSSLREP